MKTRVVSWRKGCFAYGIVLGVGLSSGSCSRCNADSLSQVSLEVSQSPTVAASDARVESDPKVRTDRQTTIVVTASGNGHFQVENRGTGAVSLSSIVSVERKHGNAWLPTNVRYVGLTERCGEKVPPCMELPSGKTLKPVPWNGYTCSGQCQRTCRSNHPVAPGIYRIIVSSCGGQEQYASEGFTQP